MITKRGKPVAKVVPVDEDQPPTRDLRLHEGHGDIINPIEQDWHAERGILYIGEDEDQT